MRDAWGCLLENAQLVAEEQEFDVLVLLNSMHYRDEVEQYWPEARQHKVDRDGRGCRDRPTEAWEARTKPA